MIENILKPKNLTTSYRQVVSNKGAAGIDQMSVDDLAWFIEANLTAIKQSIVNKKYVPKPIKGVEIPKSKGKTRLLGIPTVVDRWLQQAVSQILMTKFELGFAPFSYGFRPNKHIHKAVSQSLKYINDGYQDMVDIDLQGFFDEVDHSILLQLIYNKVKCPYTLRLIRKWLGAPILIKGKLYKRRKGVPQEGRAHYYRTSFLMNWIRKWPEKDCVMFVMQMTLVFTQSQKQQPDRLVMKYLST